MGQVEQVVRNGDSTMTYPGCVNLSFACIEGESLLMALKDIALSSGRCSEYAFLALNCIVEIRGLEIIFSQRNIFLVKIFTPIFFLTTIIFLFN